MLRYSLLAVALAGLLVGLAIDGLGLPVDPRWPWRAAIVVVCVPNAVSALRALTRRELGGDLIAVLAMLGALALDQALAGAVIAVMMAGGGALEAYAHARARRELHALLQRVPARAHVLRDGRWLDLPLDQVRLDDTLLIKNGEVVPADGLLRGTLATLDESALTGESRLVARACGELVRSGTVNAGAAVELRINATPAQSTYAGIVRLVQAAEQQRAPFVRLADRYARYFLLFTLVSAALAGWLAGDLERALAVLVVATPCPLIIAVPIAIVAGISRAARHGILVRGGAALEALADASLVLLDKTGTVTTSRAEVAAVVSLSDYSVPDVLRVAAAVERFSTHGFAPAITREAARRGLAGVEADEVREEHGAGIEGKVGAQRVRVGQLAWVAPDAAQLPQVRALARRTAAEGSESAYVTIDGSLAGALILHNPIRPEAPRVIEGLRREGIRAVHLLTGDHPDVADLVGDTIGVDRVYAERTPADKAEVVRQSTAQGGTVVVGDGINDAPALALADVGVAMGARGATVASEAADIVLVNDRLDGLLEVRRIASSTRTIALQSVIAGMTLSALGMVAAACGWLPPLHGALFQEAVDVLVIVNALRALLDRRPTRQASLAAVVERIDAEHSALRPQVAELAELAARLDSLPPAAAREALERARDQLETQLLPHERSEQELAYPSLRKLLGSEDPTGPLIQTHHEIQRRTRLFARLLAQLPERGPEPGDLPDLRRALYGLHAVLSLHFAQEDELYSNVAG